jgi:hypothetical protein
MKKLTLIISALLIAATTSFAGNPTQTNPANGQGNPAQTNPANGQGNPVKITKGNASAIKDAGVIPFEFDYTKTAVTGQGSDVFIKAQGKNEETIQSYEYFIEYFQSRKLGISTISAIDPANDSQVKDAKYKLIIHVAHLDLGSGVAAQFAVTFTAGGCIMDGTAEIIETSTGNPVITMSIDKFKAHSRVKDNKRLGILYKDIAEFMIDALED